jgi:hypothetical protein
MGKTKKVATGEEMAVAVPIIIEVVQVQVAFIYVAIQVRHVAVATRILPDRNA